MAATQSQSAEEWIAHFSGDGPIPDIVFDVVSKSDRWKDVISRVVRYQSIDVPVVAVHDPNVGKVFVFTDDAGVREYPACADTS